MSEDLWPSPPAKSRLLAATLYCGGAIVFAPFKSWRDDEYISHHYAQALALNFVFLVTCVFSLVGWVSFSYLLIYKGEWYASSRLDPFMLATIRRAFLAWSVVWIFSIGWALTGSWGVIPLIGRLTRWKRLLKCSLIGQGVLAALVAALVAAGTHAHFITRADTAPAKAYMLYDDRGFFPRWLFTLGFYPIAVTSTARWGTDSVVVAELTKENLAQALVDGKFVFLSTHGSAEGLFTTDLKITPGDAAPNGVGDDLQFVYLTGCDSGALAREWQTTLAPAEVVTFDRLSAIFEHIVWLVFRGAGKVAELK